MPWYDLWGFGPWIIFPIVMCFAMMAMMLSMGRGRMGWCSSGQMGGQPIDPALETLRQRLASGELTRQEYEERRNLLLKA